MNPQLLSWTIIGTAALLLALSVVVLARLRWIQTRPMNACIVLSVFAHLLLLATIYFSRVFDLPFIPGGDQAIVVRVTLDDAEALDEQRDQEKVHPPALPDSAPAEPEPSLSPLPQDDKPDSRDDLGLDEPELPEVIDERPLDPAEGALLDEETESEPEDVAAQPSPPPVPVYDALPLAPPPLDTAVPSFEEPMVSPLAAAPPLLEVASPADAEPSENTPPPPPPTADEPSASQLATDSAPDQTINSIPIPSRYRERVDRPSDNELHRRGGNPQSEAAVNAALNWLAAAQQADGRWSAVASGAGCGGWIEGQHRGSTGLQADTGITGLALLSFLGAGHTPDRGIYRDNVNKALAYLIAQQDRQGSLGGRASVYARMYCHGIATLSLCEALAISGSDEIREVAQRAIDYTVATQHRETGGWRYSPGDRGDTSQFGWQLMALVSAREAELNVPPTIDARLKQFLSSVQKGNHGGLASYRPGHAPARSMTAEALACRLFLSSGSELRDREAAEYISSLRPGRGPRNFYYWYYATLALSQLNDESWPDWNRALQRQLIPTQRRFGQLAGSWDPDTVWGGCGGRVYTTALATLCLESYYRYAPRRMDSARPSGSDAAAAGGGWRAR